MNEAGRVASWLSIFQNISLHVGITCLTLFNVQCSSLLASDILTECEIRSIVTRYDAGPSLIQRLAPRAPGLLPGVVYSSYHIVPVPVAYSIHIPRCTGVNCQMPSHPAPVYSIARLQPGPSQPRPGPPLRSPRPARYRCDTPPPPPLESFLWPPPGALQSPLTRDNVDDRSPHISGVWYQTEPLPAAQQ